MFLFENAPQRLDVDSVGPKGRADHTRAASQKRIAQAGINRIFEHHGFAMRRKHPLDQVERLLASAGDQNFVIRPSFAAPPGFLEQVAAQRTISTRRPELKNVRGFRANR